MVSTGTTNLTTVIALLKVANRRTPNQFSAESTTERPIATSTPRVVNVPPSDCSQGR